jgi:3-oxoacyl-[acyl-carrier protein] reductase
MAPQTQPGPKSGAPVALVTGGSRGIGRGIGVELARAGLDLVLGYSTRRQEAEEAADAALNAATHDGARVEIFGADISDRGPRQALLAFTKDRFGRLDVLVNNAGIAPEVRVDLLQASEESFERLVRVNLKAPYFLSQTAANWMIEQRNARGPGYAPRIINITSISAYAASPERGDYCVSKAGLSMTTKLFAARLAEYGIPVFEVRPGIITTDMTSGVTEKYDALIENGLLPMPRWGTPEDVGRAVAALATGQLPYSTGDVINIDGGFHLRRL